MAGHSQYSNIMHRKGAQDKKRSKIFAKLSREITVAAKSGDPDVATNPRLRLAIQNARSESMPKDNIERAIAKANQSVGGDDFEEIRYEGFGPSGVGIIVESLTDNRNRTAPNVRAIFGKRGGNMGETGSVTFNFERIGVIEYPIETADADKMFEEALNAGANDVSSQEDKHFIETVAEDLNAVTMALEKVFGTPSVSRLDWKPLVEVDMTDFEKAKSLMGLIEALEEDDDVQKVYTNANFPDDIMKKLIEEM